MTLPTDKLYFVFKPLLGSHTEDDCIEIVIINDIIQTKMFMSTLIARRNNDGYGDLHTICTSIDEARAIAATLLTTLKAKLNRAQHRGLQQLIDDTIMGWGD